MKIAVLAGDGIGKEVTAEALKVLQAVVPKTVVLEVSHAPIGGAGVEAAGDPLPAATLELARRSDAILFGAAGEPGDEKLPFDMRPGASLLRLRKALGLFANFRPAFLFPELADASSLKREIVDGLDLMILRELTGDLYFGEPRGVTPEGGERVGINTMRYSESEVRRIGHAAFRAARLRNRKVCSVDKANVLEAMQLWREVMTDVGKEYPDVELTHMFVDAAAMLLMRNPRQFDVIVTGMLPSGSLGSGTLGLYEPVHGTAPDIAGKDIANPLAAILSVEMMMRLSFDLPEAADRIRRAVSSFLAEGYRTADIYQQGTRKVGTREMCEAVHAALR